MRARSKFPLWIPPAQFTIPVPDAVFDLDELDVDDLSAPLCRLQPSHTAVDLRLASEGAVIVGRCSCGGRTELLVDVRDLPFPVHQKTLTRIFRASAGPNGALRRWLELHRDCPDTPMAHELDEQVGGVQDHVWRAATLMLERGIRVPAAAHVLLDSGEICVVPLEDDAAPVDAAIVDEPPPVEFEAHAAFRQFARERGLRPIAAVLVQMTWAMRTLDESGLPSHGSQWQETLVVSTATPTYGCVLGGILDPNHRTRSSEAIFRDIYREPLDAPCYLLDGLMARRCHSR